MNEWGKGKEGGVLAVVGDEGGEVLCNVCDFTDARPTTSSSLRFLYVPRPPPPLRQLPPPRVARLYYEADEMYLFEEFQTERLPGSRHVAVRSITSSAAHILPNTSLTPLDRYTMHDGTFVDPNCNTTQA